VLETSSGSAQTALSNCGSRAATDIVRYFGRRHSDPWQHRGNIHIVHIVQCVQNLDDMDDFGPPGRIYTFCTRLRALWTIWSVVVRVHSSASKLPGNRRLSACITMRRRAVTEGRGNGLATLARGGSVSCREQSSCSCRPPRTLSGQRVLRSAPESPVLQRRTCPWIDKTRSGRPCGASYVGLPNCGGGSIRSRSAGSSDSPPELLAEDLARRGIQFSQASVGP
jgi:hypothetical protein